MSGAIYSFNRPNDRFVIVSNDLVEDVELKHAAFRIVVYIGRHAETFRLTQEAIGRALGMDRGTVARHLAHLEELGYLRRIRNFTAAGRQADDLYVSQSRLSPEEWEAALPSPCGKTPQCKTPRGKTQQRKKTNSKKTNLQEDQPSGGDTAGAAPAGVVEEEPVKTKSPQPALFEVEAPPLPPRQKDSKDVVAAYVDSFRAAHSRDPLRSDIGRVASTAKALLGRSEATVEELISCARTMGTGTWANLSQELKNSRSPRRAQTAPKNLPLLSDDPRWDPLADATRREEEALMQAHPDMWTEEVMA